MAAEMPVIPKAESILIHTGNIVNWNRLKRKLTQSPSEELAECLGSTVEVWLDGADRESLQEATSLECFNHKFMEELPADEREELKVTAKVCLCTSTPSSAQEAVVQVMEELGLKQIDTVLLSVPENCRTLEALTPLWSSLEEYVGQEQVFTLGTADLDKVTLEQLYNATKVKPSVNQVNLASCCVMPPEMVEYAKDNDIQLLTHNDPTDLLPAESLRGIFKDHLTDADSRGWNPSWVVRYSVIIKCRGIIKTKGYIVKASRNLRLQP